MIPLTIRSATAIYGDASHCEIVRHAVDHPSVGLLSRAQRDLTRSLGDEAREEFWRRGFGPLKRAAFALCSTPLPFNSVPIAAGLDWQQVRLACRQACVLYPDHAVGLRDVAQRLEVLLAEEGNPFIAPLEALLEGQGSLCLAISNPRMNRPVSEFLANHPSLSRIRLVSTAQLRGGHYCETLVFLGPCGWFPDHVFTAPRAPSIHVLLYPWIRDGWKPEPLFLHNTKLKRAKTGHGVGRQPCLRDSRNTPQPLPDDLDPQELLPMVVAASAGLRGDSATHVGDEQEEVVPARVCLLSGDRAVFLEAEENSSALVIDTSEFGHVQVRRTPVDELEPGMYLLLRTAGGGDYIAPLADRLMGQRAAEARRLQELWKERLKATAVARFGSRPHRDLAARAASEIRKLGAARANENNVCYWMSPKCIRTRYIEDFMAVVSFAGLADQGDVLWRTMEFVDRAHRRAGHVIRRMLLKKIAECSLDELERDGYMQFDLDEHDGGSLGAFRINGLLPDQCEVPIGKIGIPFDLEA